MKNNQLSSVRREDVPLVNFFQLLRHVERETGLRLGSDLPVTSEPIFLRADPESQFPSTEVTHWNAETPRPEVLVSLFGLIGASGALPLHYSQLLAERARLRDFALRDFLDMFNHRLLSFFYRAWEKHSFPVAFETARAAGIEDRVTSGLKSLVGLRTGGLWDRLSFPSQEILYFSGHFANRRPAADSICSMIGEVFDAAVRIEQFVGQLMFIQPPDQSKIGYAPLGKSLGNQLGVDTIAGQWVWDFQNKFRVSIGPMPYKRFLEFNPGNRLLDKLWDLVRVYVGPQFDFDVQVVVQREEVAMAQVGNQERAYLGWNTWLGEWKKEYDSHDAIFQLADR